MNKWLRLTSANYGRIIAIALGMLLLIGCMPALSGASTQVISDAPLNPATATFTPTPSPEPTLTLPPTAEALVQPTSIGEGATLVPTVTTTPTPIPPEHGSFDVYLSAPDDVGKQKIQWIEEVSGVAVTEVTIQAQDKQAVRAGQYIYFMAAGTNQLMRINTGGGMQAVGFASPPPDAAFYDFALSANGNFLAWVIVKSNGEYSLHFSDSEGALNRVLISGTAVVGDQFHVLRVSNDGRKVFYDYRPTTITHRSLFRGMYNLSVIDVATGTSAPLPGEPACGEIFVCDAHISPDGAFLIRTLPPARFRQPIKVTNLVTSVILQQFAPPESDTVFPVDVGYPFFTPGGELVYVEAYGPTTLESYRLIWANIVTGEQRIIAELGESAHRPLGWASGGETLLTTRETGWYDTWQINLESGEMKQIAGLMFLGHIEEPPLVP